MIPRYSTTLFRSTYQELDAKPYKTTVIEGTTAAPSEATDHEFVLEQDVDLWRTELDWATPDDLDLEVYRKEDGKLVEVGSSGNMPGEKELVEVPNASAGTYVLRVINYASVSPDYTLTESFFAAKTKVTDGKRESYTLTCEKKGKVLQTLEIFIDRGQVEKVDLSACRRKA